MVPKYFVIRPEDIGKTAITKMYSEEFDNRLYNLRQVLKKIIEAPSYVSGRGLVEIARKGIEFDKFLAINNKWDAEIKI